MAQPSTTGGARGTNQHAVKGVSRQWDGEAVAGGAAAVIAAERADAAAAVDPLADDAVAAPTDAGDRPCSHPVRQGVRCGECGEVTDRWERNRHELYDQVAEVAGGAAADAGVDPATAAKVAGAMRQRLQTANDQLPVFVRHKLNRVLETADAQGRSLHLDR